MYHTLYPHQEDALRYAKGRTRIGLFMDMRLGKSVVAIRWAKTSGDIQRILLLGPIAAIPDWCVELENEQEYYFDLTGLEKHDRIAALHHKPRRRVWYLVNYESFRRTPEFWEEHTWDAVIADESSMFRNPKAALTKIMVNKFMEVKYRAALTGTPNPESSTDYYSQMEFLHGEFCGFHNFWAFRHVLYRPDTSGYGWVPKPGTRERIKDELMAKTFQLTRKQAKVGPGKVYERRFVDPTPEQKKAFDTLKKKFAWGDLETNWATTREIWLQRIAGGFSPDREHPRMMSDAKTKEILALLAGDLKGQSVVIWFHFREEMDYVAHTLRQKYTVNMIHGGVDKPTRAAIRQKFKEKKLQVLLMQIKTGRFAMNLSAADTAIYYSFTYSLEEHQQSEDRIVHMKKKYPLLYIFLMTKHSPDEDVVDALKEKEQTSAQFRSKLLQNIQARFGPPVGSPRPSRTRLVLPE